MTEIFRRFDEFEELINVNSNLQDSALNMIEALNYARKISNKENHDYVKGRVLTLQCNMPFGFILKSNPKYHYDSNWSEFKNKKIDCFSNEKELLNYIVRVTISYLLYRYSKNRDLDKFDFANMCCITSKTVSSVCNNLGVKNEIVKIEPGFNSKYNLFDGSRFHYFNIVTINDTNYIVDCSYKQFFDVNVTLLEQNGIYGMGGASCGIYMMQNENRLKTAQELLDNGWIMMDSNNMKNYFDGFAISFRNASYYYDLGCIDFSTDYTASDYENFIFGDDDQGKHEPLKYLGKQKRFVKKPNVIFKTDEKIIENLCK